MVHSKTWQVDMALFSLILFLEPRQGAWKVKPSEVLALLVIASIPLGCSSSGGGGRPPEVETRDPEMKPGGADPSQSFAGAREAIPLDKGVMVFWEPWTEERLTPDKKKVRVVKKNVVYLVYLSTLPQVFDPSKPAAMVKDTTHVTIDDLKNGIPLWATVWAKDSHGKYIKDMNALCFVPAPFFYVKPGNKYPLRDGKSPETAFSELSEAFDKVPQPSTLYVCKGSLGGGIVIPPGVSIVGGFPGNFVLSKWDPFRYPTRISPADGEDTVLSVTGRGMTQISGVVIDAEYRAGRCLAAYKTGISVRNVSFFRAKGDTVELWGDPVTEEPVGGDFTFNKIYGSTGPGMVIKGHTDLRIQDTIIKKNAGRGIIARELAVNPDGDLLLEIRDCTIVSNRAEGLEIGIVKGPYPGGKEGPGRINVKVAGTLMRDNLLAGLVYRAELEEEPEVEARMVVTGSDVINNGGSGVLLQPSRMVEMIVHGSRISANRGKAGIMVSGGDGGIVRICNNAVFGNAGDGIRVNGGDRKKLVMVHNNDIAANNKIGLMVNDMGCAALSNTIIWNSKDVEAPWLACTLRKTGSEGPGIFYGNPGYLNFPVGFQFVVNAGGKGFVHVKWPGVTAPGEFVELGDDGIARVVEEVTNTGIKFSPPLKSLPPQNTALYVFLKEEAVKEDLRIVSSSPALKRGIWFLKDKARGYASCGFTGGPFSVSNAGIKGREEIPPMEFSTLDFFPPPGTRAGEVDRITVIAGRELDEKTVNTSTVFILKAANLGKIPVRIHVFGKDRDRFVVAGLENVQDAFALVLTQDIKDKKGTRLSLPVFAYYPR